MNILRDNPVLRREMRWRKRPRSASLLWICLAPIMFIALAILVVPEDMLGFMFLDTSRNGQFLYTAIMFLEMLCVVLIVPARAATSINRERELQTWDVLAVTRLTPGQVFLGKWLGRQSIAGWVLAIGFPLSFWLGQTAGLPASATVLSYLYLGLTSAFLSACGMWCSFYTRRQSATAATLIVSGTLCIGTVLAHMFAQSIADWAPFLWFNPFYMLSSLMEPSMGRQLTSHRGMYDPEFLGASFLVNVSCEVGLIVGVLFCMTRQYRLSGKQ